MRNYCRVPMTPDILLNPNVTRISKARRKKLPYPLNLKSAQMVKAIIKGQLRQCAQEAAEQVKDRVAIPGPVVLEVTIAYEKGRKAPDFDNAISTLKGVIDGVTKAGFMYDDNQVIGIFLDLIKDPERKGYTDITVRQAKRDEVRHEWRERLVQGGDDGEECAVDPVPVVRSKARDRRKGMARNIHQ